AAAREAARDGAPAQPEHEREEQRDDAERELDRVRRRPSGPRDLAEDRLARPEGQDEAAREPDSEDPTREAREAPRPTGRRREEEGRPHGGWIEGIDQPDGDDQRDEGEHAASFAELT